MNTEDTQQQDAPLSTGKRLQLAREQLGLSQSTVAARLRLKISTIRDIEEDHLSADLASTFTRGYVRSYARLVHIPEHELLPEATRQTQLNRPNVTSIHSFSPVHRRKKRDGWLTGLTWIILIVVIGLTGAWWWQNHKAQQVEIRALPQVSSSETPSAGAVKDLTDKLSVSHPSPRNDTKETSLPLQIAEHQPDAASKTAPAAPVTSAVSTSSVVAAAAASPSATAAPSSVTTSAATSVTSSATPSASTSPSVSQTPASASLAPPVSQPATPLPAPVSTGANTLSMSFTNDCWIEVSDNSGRRLFSGTKHKGDQLVLNGQPPYQLRIGAPAAVQISYQGKSVDLRRFPANRVARLTLNAAP